MCVFVRAYVSACVRACIIHTYMQTYCVYMQATDIDNAGDLDHVGGLSIIIDLLTHKLPRVQQAAFWVLGTTVCLFCVCICMHACM
jgi:hypothetical protein